MLQVAAMCVLDLRGYNITGTYLTLKLQAIHTSGANLGLAPHCADNPISTGVCRSRIIVSVENHKAGGKQKAVRQVYTALDQLCSTMC